MVNINTDMIAHYLQDYKPTADIVILFDDKTSEDRTNEQIDEMFEKIVSVVNEYGFDIHMWGYPSNMYKALKSMYEK